MFKWKTLAAFALAACGSAFAANNMFSDVPRTHWAYEAIDRAVAAGILQGYDGKFHGDKLVNRYQMAVIIKKILDNVGSAGGAMKAGMKPEDVKNLEQLTIEFADELALLNTKVSTLEDSFVQLRGEVDKMKGGSGAGAKGGEGLTNAFTGMVAVAFVATDDGGTGTTPLPAGSQGALTRYTGTTADQMFFTLPQASIALDKEVSEGIGLHVQYDYGTDLINPVIPGGPGGVGLNEAYLMVDELFGDIGAKIGGFALPMQSWEINGPFRTCNMTITPSVVNTTFEAVRVVGLEVQKMKDVDPSDIQWRLGIFNGGDVPAFGPVLAGTMSDQVGLAALARSATFDDSFGFFISLESGNDPDKSWGWRLDWINLGGDTNAVGTTVPVPAGLANSNEFDGWQVGFWWKNEDFKVMLQYLNGSNQFANIGPGNNNDVTAWYVLLNYKFNEDNSLSVRYDDWQNDIDTPGITTGTTGNAFTFAWNHKTSDTSMFQFEWLTPDESVQGLPAGTPNPDVNDDLVQFRYKVWF